MNSTPKKERPLKVVPSERERKKIREKKRRIAFRRKLLLSLFSILLLVVLFFTLPIFKIRSYEIKGATHSDLTRLSEASAGLKGQNLLIYSPKNVLAAVSELPYIDKIKISTSINGVVTIDVTEKKRDYVLKIDDVYLIMDKYGFVLEESPSMPTDVVELKDNPTRVQPGTSMYNKSEKEKIITEFKKLMDLNTSTIGFSEFNITDEKNLKLKYGGWIVELGDSGKMKEKLNHAINILKELKMEDEGVVDLKYETSPVIRKKKVSNGN